ERAGAPATRLARRRRDAVADRRAHRGADRGERTLLGRHGGPRARGRRDDDRPDGDGQHAGPVLEPVQRLPDALGEHRDRAPRGRAQQHALPDPLPRRAVPLRDHVPLQLAGRVGAAALPPEGVPAVTALRELDRRRSVKRSIPRRLSRRTTSLSAQGEPMLWLTGGALVFALAMIAGLLVLVASRGASTFWPQPI